jgi:hypothetical protein
MKKILVTITSSNKNQKIHQEEIECKNMVDVCRLLLTYQGKRGYEEVNVMIDFVEVMV